MSSHSHRWTPKVFDEVWEDFAWISVIAIAWYPCYQQSMIVSFRDPGTEDIFNGRNSRHARQRCPRNLWPIAVRKLDQLDSVVSLDDLRIPPGNQLQALAGDRCGQASIRINQRYRICFMWTVTGPVQVEIVDYHWIGRRCIP